MKYIKNVKGFTLLELMIVVAILGILAAIAYPSFQYTLAVNRAKKAEADINKTLAYARSQAISQNKYIGICPMSSTNSDSCAPSGDDCKNHIKNPLPGCAWSNGFIVYIDQNKNKTYDSTDKIIQQIDITESRLSIALASKDLIWKAGGLSLLSDNSPISEDQTITIISSENMSKQENARICKIATTGKTLCSSK